VPRVAPRAPADVAGEERVDTEAERVDARVVRVNAGVSAGVAAERAWGILPENGRPLGSATQRKPGEHI
jgi:hypothetical protein